MRRPSKAERLTQLRREAAAELCLVYDLADAWTAAEAREVWQALGPLERLQVCAWIVTPRVAGEAARLQVEETRLLGCLHLCALADGYRVSFDSI